MAVAAQLHGSAAAAAYRRLPASGVPSYCRRPQDSLAGYPKLSISTGTVGVKPFFRFGAEVSTKCANGTTQVDDLKFTSNQIEELVEADEDTVTQKRSAKIHDFCLGIPFGGLLFCMGLLGYILSRSTISLVLGVAPGLATLFLATVSLNLWRSGKSSFVFIMGQAAISALLAWKYSHAYLLVTTVLLLFHCHVTTVITSHSHVHLSCVDPYLFVQTNRILPWGFYASLRYCALHCSSKAFFVFVKNDLINCYSFSFKMVQHCHGLFLRICVARRRKSTI
ncbi:hypothetical protein ABZP36_007616 [Zizania latifolia]